VLRVLGHLLEGLLPLLVVDGGARDLLEQVEALLVGHHAQRVHLALLHDVVRVGLGEAGGLEEGGDVVLVHALAVQEELVLLEADGAAEDDLRERGGGGGGGR
jgi:hypothetical protein